jgi:hypothetical protein
MESMQFWTKLVLPQNDIRLKVSQAGGIIMLVCALVGLVLEKTGNSSDLPWVGLIAGLAIALIGWVLRGFKVVRPLVTNTDIIITIDEIRVGDQRFAVCEIEYLDFLVNSYHGMVGPRLKWRRMTLRGDDNKLFFWVDGKKHSYSFYLEDEMAMRRLGMLFREFYRQRLRFRERNRGGRTFLFSQVMDRQAFERAKREEGYD